MIEVEKVQPTGLFTNYIFKAIPLAFDESMSYYETLCGLLDYLKNTVIPTLNNNADAMVELQGIVQDLQTYVDNYFDNLDVQEEINNKLDEMVEDGTLQEVVGAYLQTKAVFGFDSVADLKASTNLINDSFAETYGFYNYNDGGGALYKIRTITNLDTIDNITLISLTNSDTLVAELILKDEMPIECFGAYGDGIHDDTNSFDIALNKNVTIKLKDNANYNIIKIYTTNVNNIKMKADNNSNIKWNITSTALINNNEGMISDDNLEDDPVGGDVYLENISFNGNGDNITEFPNLQNFGLFHLRNRKNVYIKNCKFEKIHCNAINLRGYEKCIVENCDFENIGRYQNADGTRNGLTITRTYVSREDNSVKYLTNTPITSIKNCKFSHIADECVRIDGCSNLVFENNNCNNIGQHIIESGHNTDASDYVVTILNCNANKVGQAIYTFGADGGGSWSHTGKVLVENCKFTDLCYQDDFSLYKRDARPYIIPGYVANYSTYSPDIEIINSEFKTINSTITYTSNQKMIFGKNVYVKDSIFNYYNTAGSVPMFQAVNLHLDNVQYEITQQVGNKFLIDGLDGNISVYNSTFKIKSFEYPIRVTNCNTYFENCRFYEDTSSTGYRYMVTVKGNADYKSSISFINCKLVNTTDTASNCYAFTTTESTPNYKLDIMRLNGNYYNFNNLNSKAYSGGADETYNLLVNVNNNKYNAS